jgi:hypothetical protein
MIFSQAGLESIPGSPPVSWKRKSFEKRGRAVALLRRRHPVLKKAEGDWAASWLFRHWTKSHNRTIRERKKKDKFPQKWASMVAARKVKRFKQLNEELEGGDMEAIEAAILARARGENTDKQTDDSSQASREPSAIPPESDDEEESSYERFYDIADDQPVQETRVSSSRHQSVQEKRVTSSRHQAVQEKRVTSSRHNPSSNRTQKSQTACDEDEDEVGSERSYSTLHFGPSTPASQLHRASHNGKTTSTGQSRPDSVRYRGATEAQQETIGSITRLLGMGTGVPNPYAVDHEEDDLRHNNSGQARGRAQTRGSSEGYTPPPQPKISKAPPPQPKIFKVPPPQQEDNLRHNNSGQARGCAQTRGSSEGYTPPPQPKIFKVPPPRQNISKAPPRQPTISKAPKGHVVPAKLLAKVMPAGVNRPKQPNHPQAQGQNETKSHRLPAAITPRVHADQNSPHESAKQRMPAYLIRETTVASFTSEDDLPAPPKVLERLQAEKREQLKSAGISVHATTQAKTKRSRVTEQTPAQMEFTNARKKPKILNNSSTEGRHKENTPEQFEETEPNKTFGRHLNGTTKVRRPGARPARLPPSKAKKVPKQEPDSNMNLDYPDYRASRIEGAKSVKAIKDDSADVYLKSPVGVKGPSQSSGSRYMDPSSSGKSKFQFPITRLNCTRMTYNDIQAPSGRNSLNSTVPDTRDSPELSAADQSRLITDADGFDDQGIDEEGYNMLGFDVNGVNRSGQLSANFPPQFLMDMKYTAHWYQAKGVSWVAPVFLNEVEVREKYPSWYAEHEAIWPTRSQVRTPEYTNICSSCLANNS